MIKKWIFAAGAGLGYVLGTRAGRERYEQMRLQARQLMENPKVKETTEEAARLVEEGRLAVRDKMRKLNHHDEDDLVPASVGSSTTTTTASPTPKPAGWRPPTARPPRRRRTATASTLRARRDRPIGSWMISGAMAPEIIQDPQGTREIRPDGLLG